MASKCEEEIHKENERKRKVVHDAGGDSAMKRSADGGREETPPAPCSALCGPRSCSTLPSQLQSQMEDRSHSEPKRRRIWGLRGLVKMFRRRVRRKGIERCCSPQGSETPLRARSNSELGPDQPNRSLCSPYTQVLSVSHDSVFSPESPPELESKEHPVLSLSSKGINMTELKSVLRHRRGKSPPLGEEDPGLPRSPPTSPTTLDVLNHGLKGSRATHSTCSDASLLSMGSSENDEDSFACSSSVHSSKASLSEGGFHLHHVDPDPVVGFAPLNHQAARHKISVRPRRTHRVIRQSKSYVQAVPSSLPTTPEVNEEVGHHHHHSGRSPTRSQQLQRSSYSSSAVDGFNRRKESPVCISHDSESAREKEKESENNKNDEPFLNRIFGSARDSSLSPLRRVMKSSRGKAKRKSDPSKVEIEEKTCSKRSSSVEGRLEGNSEEENVSSRPNIQQKSDEEVGAEANVEASVLNKSIEKSQKSKRLSSSSRLSTSYNSLDYVEELHGPIGKVDSVERKSPSFLNYRENETRYMESGREGAHYGRSSTDSLTTTPLPGIYIRPFKDQNEDNARISTTVSQAKVVSLNSAIISADARTSLYQNDKWKDKNEMDVDSGPLSLDSSLNTVSYEDERLKKTASVDQVSVLNRPQSRSPILSAGNGELLTMARLEEGINLKVRSPPPHSKSNVVSRSHSVHSPSSHSRRMASNEEKQQERISFRKAMGKDVHTKQPKSPDAVQKVPEFMRIHLNRVSPGRSSSMIDSDGGHEQRIETEETPQIVDPKIESKKLSHDVMIEKRESKIAQSDAEIPTSSSFDFSSKNHKTIPDANTGFNSKILKEYKPDQTKTNPTETTVPIEKSTVVVNMAKSEEKHDEIVLRRPSVIDRSAVFDQHPPSPIPCEKASDQPELLKVFARRSFKNKDGDLEPPKDGDHDDSSNVDEVFDKGLDSSVYSNSSSGSTDIQQNVIGPLKNIPAKISNDPDAALNSTVIILSGNNNSTEPNESVTDNMNSSSINEEKSISPKPSNIFLKASASFKITSSSSTSQRHEVFSKVSHENGKVGESSVYNVRKIPPVQVSSITPIKDVKLSGSSFNSNIINKIQSGNASSSTPASSVDVQSGVDHVTRIVSMPKPVYARGTSLQWPPSSPDSKISATIVANKVQQSAAQQARVVSPTPKPDPIKSRPSPVQPGSFLGSQPASKRTNLESQNNSPIPKVASEENRSLVNSKILDTYSSHYDANSRVGGEVDVNILNVSKNVTNVPKSLIKSNLVSEPMNISSGIKSSFNSPIEVEEKENKPSAKIDAVIKEKQHGYIDEIASNKDENDKDDSALSVSAVRRRFTSGGSSSSSLSVSNFATIKSSIIESSTILAEARNTSSFPNPSLAYLRSSSKPDDAKIGDQIEGINEDQTPKSSSFSSMSSSFTSESSPNQSYKLGGGSGSPGEDWRVLVRQRREDRLKQNKTPELEDIIMENRPSQSRNSKVLELASNFQKLQVA